MALTRTEKFHIQDLLYEQDNDIVAETVQVFVPPSYSSNHQYVFNFDSFYVQIGDNNNITVRSSQSSLTDFQDGRPVIRVLGNWEYSKYCLSTMPQCEAEEKSTASITVRENGDREGDPRKELNIRAKIVQIIPTETESTETTSHCVNVNNPRQAQIGNSCQLILESEPLPVTRRCLTRAVADGDIRQGIDCSTEEKRRDIDGVSNHRDRRSKKTCKRPNKSSKKRKECVREKQKQLSKDLTTLYSLSDSASLTEISETFSKVATMLNPLRDDGKWDILQKTINKLRTSFHGEPNKQMVLTLEQGFAECYRSKLAESEKVIKDVLCMIQKAPLNLTNRLLKGRAYCYLAAVYRKAKLPGQAQRYLEKSEELFSGVNSAYFVLDQAFLCYEKGSLLVEFDNKKVSLEQAMPCFEKCEELCVQYQAEQGCCEFVKIDYFAKLQRAMLLVDCQSKQRGTKRDKCLAIEMEMNLNDLKLKVLSEMPKCKQVEFLLVLSDRSYASKNFDKVKMFVKMAFNLAAEFGFDTAPYSNRLQAMEEFYPANRKSVSRACSLEVMSRGEESEGYTADAEFDSLESVQIT